MHALALLLAVALNGGRAGKQPSTEVLVGEMRKLESSAGTRLLGICGHHALVTPTEAGTAASEVFAIDLQNDRKVKLGAVEGRVQSVACADWDVKICAAVAASESGGAAALFVLARGKARRFGGGELGDRFQLDTPLSPGGLFAVLSRTATTDPASPRELLVVELSGKQRRRLSKPGSLYVIDWDARSTAAVVEERAQDSTAAPSFYRWSINKDAAVQLKERPALEHPPAVTQQARDAALARLLPLPEGCRYELTEDGGAVVIIENGAVVAAAFARLAPH
jgi:hypothetical protein